MLRIITALKNASSSAGFKPVNFGSNSTHDNIQTTENDYLRTSVTSEFVGLNKTTHDNEFVCVHNFNGKYGPLSGDKGYNNNNNSNYFVTQYSQYLTKCELSYELLELHLVLTFPASTKRLQPTQKRTSMGKVLFWVITRV